MTVQEANSGRPSPTSEVKTTAITATAQPAPTVKDLSHGSELNHTTEKMERRSEKNIYRYPGVSTSDWILSGTSCEVNKVEENLRS